MLVNIKISVIKIVCVSLDFYMGCSVAGCTFYKTNVAGRRPPVAVCRHTTYFVIVCEAIYCVLKTKIFVWWEFWAAGKNRCTSPNTNHPLKHMITVIAYIQHSSPTITIHGTNIIWLFPSSGAPTLSSSYVKHFAIYCRNNFQFQYNTGTRRGVDGAKVPIPKIVYVLILSYVLLC